MARTCNITFEWEDYDWAGDSPPGFDAYGGGLAISTTYYKGGAKSAQCTSLSSGTPKYWAAYHREATNGQYTFARIWFKVDTAPAANTTIIGLASTATTIRSGIRLTTARKLQLINGVTQVGSDSDALDVDTWYRIDIQADYASVAGSQTLEARLSGAVFATSSTETLLGSGGVPFIWVGGNLNSEANASGTWYFDCIAVNDDTGTAETSYPPDGYLTVLRPNATGEYSDGAGSGGDTYTTIDDDVPDLGTTYWDLQANSDKVSVNIEPYADGGIGASDTINLVEVKGLIGAPAVGGLYPGTMLGYTGDWDEASASRQNGPDYHPFSVYTPLQRVSRGIWYLNPSDTSAWEPSDLSDLQIGFHSTDADPDNRINAAMLVVDFTPSGAPPETITPDKWIPSLAQPGPEALVPVAY